VSNQGVSLALHLAAGVVRGIVAESDSRLATVCFVGGFAPFMLVSTWAG
jgi:hypothetical protein